MLNPSIAGGFLSAGCYDTAMVLRVRRALALSSILFFVACSGGRDKLIAGLQSPRPDQRAQAVKKLADDFEPDDIALFTQAARDPVAIVRAEAVTALGKSNDARVVDLLGEALGDQDEEVQARAAVALADTRSDKARAYLTLQYGRRGRPTRLVIVQALKSANVPGAMASVVAAEASAIWDRNLRALTQGSLPERVGAAEQLGRSGRAEAVNRLVPLLKDNQIVLAAAAARGLGYAGDARAAPALSVLLDENYPELREAACEALARLKDPSALPKLMAVANEHSPSSPLAAAAIVALPTTPETSKALCDISLAVGGPEVMTAAREMRRRGGCPLEPIADKLRNQSSVAAALNALIGLGPSAKELSSKVVPLLTSNDATTRKLAVDALTEMGDPSSAVPLLKAYDAEVKTLEPLRADWVPAELPKRFAPGFDPAAVPNANDPSTRVRAKTAELFKKLDAVQQQRLQETGKASLQSRPPHELVDDASEDQLKVLSSLIRALGVLKAEGARERLEPWLRESSPSVRAAASAALGALGGDSLKLAAAGLFDGERRVQSATAQALGQAGAPGQTLLLDAIRQLNGDRSRLLEGLRGEPLPATAVPVLLPVVKEGGADAALAASLLGDIRSPDVVAPLMTLLDDQTMVGRRDVLIALGHLRDPRSAEVVGRDLYSDSADIRAAAAEALATIGVGTNAEALDALKGDYSFNVRETAQATITHLGEKH